MKIALGADHAGFELKEKIKEYLLKKGGIEVIDKGTNSKESVDYPKYGHAVANAVVSKGVRAALCTDTTTAKLTREHNDANILALGSGIVGQFVALDIVDTFLSTAFEGGRHKTRVDQIEVEGCNLF